VIGRHRPSISRGLALRDDAGGLLTPRSSALTPAFPSRRAQWRRGVQAPWSQWRGPCRTCTDFPALHRHRECSRRPQSRAAERRGRRPPPRASRRALVQAHRDRGSGTPCGGDRPPRARCSPMAGPESRHVAGRPRCGAATLASARRPSEPGSPMNPRRSVAIAAVIFRHQCLKWSAIICDPRRSPKRREAPHVQGLRESGARGLEHPDLLGAIQQARRAVPRQNRPISGALCRRGRRAVRANRRRCSAILADSGTHCGECLNGTFKRGPSCASRRTRWSGGHEAGAAP
jgi:hypothetical protein